VRQVVQLVVRLAVCSTTCCGLAVRQVVQLVVRLAVCSTTCCGLAVRQVVQLVVRLAVCSTTCCGLLSWTCCWLSICCQFVVQLVVTACCTTNPQRIEILESDTKTTQETVAVDSVYCLLQSETWRNKRW